MNINQTKLKELVQAQGIRHVVLYGSQAVGDATAESDFDVAVFLEPARVSKFHYDGYIETLTGLAEVLGVDASKLDLVLLNTANILLRYEITSKSELLFGDPDEFAQYQAFAFRDYIDARPLFDLESYMLVKRQALIAQHA